MNIKELAQQTITKLNMDNLLSPKVNSAGKGVILMFSEDAGAELIAAKIREEVINLMEAQGFNAVKLTAGTSNVHPYEAYEVTIGDTLQLRFTHIKKEQVAEIPPCIVVDFIVEGKHEDSKLGS